MDINWTDVWHVAASVVAGASIVSAALPASWVNSNSTLKSISHFIDVLAVNIANAKNAKK
jgi:hypothetical protein